MTGREVAPNKVSDEAQGDTGGSLQPWKTALAVILPVLAMALLAYQVCLPAVRDATALLEGSGKTESIWGSKRHSVILSVAMALPAYEMCHNNSFPHHTCTICLLVCCGFTARAAKYSPHAGCSPAGVGVYRLNRPL